MNVNKLLIEARELLAAPRGWGKGAFSRTREDGRTTYCAIGAIDRVCAQYDTPHAVYRRTCDALHSESRKLDPSVSAIGFNDFRSTRKADVLALYDRAIEATKPKRRGSK